jgi:hypothetical protein
MLVNFRSADLRDEHLLPLRVRRIRSGHITAQLARDDHTRTAFQRHDVIFSYGENYGGADCRVPLGDLSYKPTRQAVDVEFWRFGFDPAARHFTTVGNYRQSGNDVEFNGETYYWSKHHEWEKILDLPRHTSQTFELALGVDTDADKAHLTSRGWRIVSPYDMSLDIFGAYPAFIRQSRAELTVGKTRM